MRIGRIIGAGIVFAVISFVIHMIESIASMGYYLDPNYFSVWSKIMMPAAGPPPPEFFVLSVAFGFIAGMLYAFVFDKVKSCIKEQSAVRKGLYYGALLFLVAGIPMSMTMFLMINLPAGLTTIWTLSGFITYLIGGIAIAKIMQ
ncbi:MAG TPA: hypothetical protein VI977_03960 [archaeon]|nr:hypothetical protein [archaeon]